MKLITKSMNLLRRFQRDEKGSTTVEFIMMFPLLVWCLLATVSYFHAYRSQAIALKATITMADMISRETQYITPTYIESMRELLLSLNINDDDPQLRLTVFTWQQNRNRYLVRWSRWQGQAGGRNTTALNKVKDQLPDLANGQRAILVETWIDYEPLFNYNLGLRDFQFENFMVISPRFSTQVCWNADAEQRASEARC